MLKKPGGRTSQGANHPGTKRQKGEKAIYRNQTLRITLTMYFCSVILDDKFANHKLVNCDIFRFLLMLYISRQCTPYKCCFMYFDWQLLMQGNAALICLRYMCFDWLIDCIIIIVIINGYLAAVLTAFISIQHIYCRHELQQELY